MQACLNSTSICIGYYATANCHQIINLTNSNTISPSQFGARNSNSNSATTNTTTTGSTGDISNKSVLSSAQHSSIVGNKSDRMTGIFSAQQQNTTNSGLPSSSSSSSTTVTTVNHKMTGIRRTVSSATPSTIGIGCVSSVGNNNGRVANGGCILSAKSLGTTSTQQQQARINAAVNGNHHSNCKETHKKLDRSFSEPAEKKNLTSSASSGSLGPSSRYKTELCRSFAEVGSCKYGDKCQFAHGEEELRTVNRHPKFKTENCKSFHSTGFCPYGPRCHFIHNDESKKTITMSNMQSNNGPSTPTINQRMFENSMSGNILSGSGSNQSQTQTSMSCAQASPFATSSPTSVLNNNNGNLVRPKALSLGSYSLGSSGEVSSPSSQSGSPTSLNSFFTEDMAFVHGVPFASNGSNPRMCPSYQPTSTFSFSPDSAFDSFSATNCANSGGVSSMSFSSGNGSQKCMFGGSQPTLSSGEFSSEPTSADETANSVISSLFCGSPSNSTPLSDFMIRPMSPMGKSQMTMMYPAAPDSPVDSVTSEIEALKLGEMQSSTFSPISSSFCVSSLSSNSSGSPPTSGIADQLTSYLASSNGNNNNNTATSNIPQRLPTFTRFATNGSATHHGNSIEIVE